MQTLLAFTLADPGGAASAHPPQQDPFLSFSHTFSPKSVCVGGQRPPPMGRRPLNGKSWIRHCFTFVNEPVRIKRLLEGFIC